MHGMGCMNPSSGDFMVQRRVGDYLFAQKGQVGVFLLVGTVTCLFSARGVYLIFRVFKVSQGLALALALPVVFQSTSPFNNAKLLNSQVLHTVVKCEFDTSLA